MVSRENVERCKKKFRNMNKELNNLLNHSFNMEEVKSSTAFSKFMPENVVLVISVDNNGKPSGMTAGWIMKCSSDPPMLAITLSKSGYTHKLIKESKEFVIAIPNKGLEEELLYFGQTHGDKVDKFKKTGIETSKSKFIQTPLIKNATINFECKLEKEVDCEKETIFIGRVLASYINKDKKVLINMKGIDGKWSFEEF